MIKQFIIALFLASTLFAFGCKKTFEHDAISRSTNYLIVEGTINPAGPTNIYLSRTINLSDILSVNNELKAKVQIEGENNVISPLTETGNGMYTIKQLNLNNNQKYRLRIKTSASKEYLSDFIPVKTTPLIDSVNWIREKDGVGIYINAHDDKNDTRYYQWDYEESWELQSIGYSEFVFQNKKMARRDLQEIPKLYTCWKNQRSVNIIIGSTARLSNDIIYLNPITFIPNRSEKLGVRYSILVRQYAISREAYEYLSLMKKNSEQTGSLFDSQPSELKGNIHSVTNPDEMVIGYVGIAPLVEKRIFISSVQLPGWDFNLVCEFVKVPNNPDSLEVFSGIGRSLASSYNRADNSYTGSTAACLDCRLRGGNNNKLSFW